MTIKKILLTEDSKVDTDSPTANYGASTLYQTLYNAYNKQSACLKCSPIQVKGTVISARLALYGGLKGGITTNLTISPLNSTWSETTVTWDTTPARGDVWDTIAPDAAGWWYWDLNTATVQQWADGGNNYGMYLDQPVSSGTGADYMNWKSSETVDAEKPYVEITYNPLASFLLNMMR